MKELQSCTTARGRGFGRRSCAAAGLSVTVAIGFLPHAFAVPADLETLLKDPVAAQTFDYCARPAEHAEAEVEALTEVMKNESRAYQEGQIAAAVIISAGIEVAAANPDNCRPTFAAGEKRFYTQLGTFTKLLRGKNRFRKSRQRDIAAVQSAIADMWLKDQVARQSYASLNTEDRTGSDYWGWRLATAHTMLVDADSTALMRRLLDDYDWIDRTRFGPKISEHAWLLVQHADDHPEFQALALSRMQPYLESGGVKPANYAYLWDRVAINTGKLQRYGTQPVWACNADGSLSLHPMEDPENVDLRRSELGMRPVQAQLTHMAQSFCGQ